MIEVNVTIDATIEKVWTAFCDTNAIKEWNHASDDWSCPKAENELIVGGRFSYTMAAKDGSFSFDFSGHFEEITPLEKLIYILDDGRKVEVFFKSEAGKTIVAEFFEPETQNPEEMQQQGWQAILDNFRKYVEGQK